MPKLNALLNQLPQNPEIHMTSMGHVLWVCWQGDIPPAVRQTLFNYGGMPIGQTNDQALWFFFTNDVFLALARLSIWGRIDSLPVAIELFPGRLQLTSKREASLSLEGIISAQELLPRDNLDIYIHPTSKDNSTFVPGITFERAALRQGMAAVDWQAPIVDTRMPYNSTQAWFVVIHPLGNPLDKKFQASWREMFTRLERLFQDLKIKFIVHEGFVLAAIEDLLMLRTFLREYLRVFDKEKEEGGAYWPSVCVVADRKNLNFNAELPKKIGLKWDSLMPDFPYISYRNAFLLGEGFSVRDLRFSGGQASLDSWCNALLDENSISQRSIPLVMSARLTTVSDKGECFYCGLPNHSPAECPTRTWFPTQQDTWQQIAAMDLNGINASFRKIELALTSKGLTGFNAILETKGPESMLMNAIFDIAGLGQLRNLARNWLYRMKEPDPDEETPVKDDSPAWELLERLIRTPPDGLLALDKELAQTIARHPRDPRLRMLRAFVEIERDEPNHALALFREAAAITASPAMQAWNEFLQARLLESQGHLAQASALYSQVQRVMPQWKDVTYRGIVCSIKMGFAEQAMSRIVALVHGDPEYFNQFLVDPGVERGRLIILSELHDLWEEARKNSLGEKTAVGEVSARLHAWFPEDHPVQARLGQKIRQLEAMGQVDNYMAFFQMLKFRPQLEKDLNDSIQREVDELRNRYKSYLDTLEEIRDEASWFPFPSALKDFSQDFNESAGVINWAFSNNFGEAQTFKQAQNAMPKLDKLLQRLKKKLIFLRSVRDATLFGLTMLRTFVWIEIVGLLICFLGIPAIVFFGDKMGLEWLKYMLGENQWSIQKVLVIIVTIIALGVGALRTTLVFEKKREKLLEQARLQREKAQATRLQAIRKKREVEAKKLQKEISEAKKRESRQQLKARMQS